jgi:hypothetical protein
MMEKSTKLNDYRIKLRELKPKSETLQTIIAFASAYQIERLSNGQIVSYFLN